jgi:solute carrier family 25 protein 39/40
MPALLSDGAVPLKLSRVEKRNFKLMVLLMETQNAPQLNTRISSAIIGSIITNLAVTPFDVLKTRAQSNLHQKTKTTTIGEIQKIIHTRGLTALWKGLGAGMAISIPSTVIYYVGYESLRDAFRPNIGGYSSFAAGGLSRIVAGSYY